ncbi:mitotic spindle assembly checkpoint MAD2B [Pelobates cultripes]|uniref:Mitotic spindle assembly checkpoint protein MAD2B n=2 Tax=Pelobates cultripes TaxID=61616 RepID=A0AAD1T7A1_PELCU|nr:mitotic spindle assembly checkpoint MAD2B [Pelobates cultripes]
MRIRWPRLAQLPVTLPTRGSALAQRHTPRPPADLRHFRCGLRRVTAPSHQEIYQPITGDPGETIQLPQVTMTTLTRQDLNFGQVVADILCEFLEVAVHLILYVREVYPIGIFQKRKKYNVPVQMSCHPELNRYIQDTLHCVKPLIEKNDVEKVVVVILDKEHHPVERFVFEIAQPPLLSISSDSLLSHVEQLLRAFVLKISVCDAVLDNNPPGCTFTILVHTREAATRNMEKIQVIKDFPWILADEQDVHMQEPRLIPLKTMTSDILKMQLYVEERAQKST